jgi:potassium-dependent mechanosensitive channel
MVESAYELLKLELIQVGGNPITLGTLVLSGCIVVVTLWGSRLMRTATKRAFAVRGVHSEATISVTNRLVHYGVLLVGFGIAAETLGFRLSSLFAAGAVFAVGVGFAMQNIAENFVSGIIVLVERSIKPGDVLMLDGKLCKVERMHMRSTIVRTRDDEMKVVPNSLLAQNTVTNLTLSKPTYRIRAAVGVHYSSDMEKVRDVLTACTESIPSVQTPRINLLQFGASSVDWEVNIWTDEPWRREVLKSDLNEAIWFALKKHDVTISYPQMDLYVKELPRDAR